MQQDTPRKTPTSPGVNGAWTEDDPRDYETLGRDEQAALRAWIAVAMKPARTVGPSNSYTMKHDFETAGGFYVSNGQFKGAMLAAGYKPVKRGEQNWRFRQRPTNKRADGYSYYHALPDETELGVARFKDLVERVRAGRAS
ncbi:MAG: hypothetical protein M3Q49_02635 [Actinomycetota bacterium]|nr:hypothetical protein [Actinomycetota bacterium]MDP9484685.1 hypothetical protein [Actinomycetota bacterium]PLS87382.1 MAG: hypothetical protein CYG60_02040 [Actinomycetota bacterium]